MVELRDNNVKVFAVVVFENVNKLVVVSKDTVMLKLFPAFAVENNTFIAVDNVVPVYSAFGGIWIFKLFPALSVKYNLSFVFRYIAIKPGLAVVDVYIE